MCEVNLEFLNKLTANIVIQNGKQESKTDIYWTVLRIIRAARRTTMFYLISGTFSLRQIDQ